jgi:hypothetical protein
MNAKTISIFTFVLLCVMSMHDTRYIANAASPVNTVWEPVNVSLAQLLSSGWRILGHSNYRVATSPAPGYTPYDETQFSFVLNKNSDYIICLIPDPRPSNAKSACRKLN